MGESVLSIIIGPILLLIGVILVCKKKRPSRRETFLLCKIDFYVAVQDVNTAQSMFAHASQTTWIELCQRLYRACRIATPPMCLMQATNEAEAAIMFLKAKTELEEILEVATTNLELSRSLLRWYSVRLRADES